LTSNNLANAPYQRTGFLLGQSVYLNLGEVPSWVNVSNLQNGVAGTQAERDTVGGTIALRAESSVDLAKGSVLDVSGGSVAYSSALGRTSQLITSTGAVVDISNASADVQYIGFSDGGSRTATDPFEGISQTTSWQAPRYAMVGGYTQGKDAGTVEIYASAAQFDGTLLGHVTTSPQQRSAPPAGGQLKIGTNDDNAALLDTEAGIQRPNIVLGSNSASVQQAAAGLNGPSIELNTGTLTSEGFTRLNLTSDGEIKLAAGAPLNLGPGGQFTARANAIDIGATLYAPGGTVSLSERPLTGIPGSSQGSSNEAAVRDALSLIPESSALRGSVTVDPGVSVDVAGLWTNDLLLPTGSVPSSPVVLDGGKISISGRKVDVAGARFDVSSGALLQRSGLFDGGKGGSLTIRASYVDPAQVVSNAATGVPDTGVLDLGSGFASRIRGYGVTQGGSLSIGAPSLQLGGTPVVPTAGAPVWLDPALGFRGFQSFTFTGYDSVTVPSGATFAPRIQYLQDIYPLAYSPSNASLLNVTRPIDPLPGRLAPASISLIASNTYDGSVNVAKGSKLEAGIEGSITLTAGQQLLFDGRLDAPAGTVALSLIDHGADNLTAPLLDSRRIQIGPDATIDVSGASVTTVSPLGIRSGQVLSGGSVSIDANLGALAIDPGALIADRGTTGTIDILLKGTTYQPQTIASGGGTVELSAVTGMVVDGAIDAGGGRPTADGGNLSISLRAEQNVVGTSVDVNVQNQLLQPLDLVLQNNLPSLQFGQSLAGLATTLCGGGSGLCTSSSGSMYSTGTNPNQRFTSGYVSASAIDSAGFDHVWLQTPDVITFAQSTTLATRSSLYLASQALQAGPSAASVNLQAPYVALGPLSQISQLTSAAEAGNNPLPAATGGVASLTVGHAQQVDLIGDLSLVGFGQTMLQSSGDVRGIGALPTSESPRQGGVLQFGGNLTISAAQLYPATQTDFQICSVSCSSSATGSGSVTITGNPQGATPLPPLSAGGSLTFDVGSFNVGNASATGAAAGGRVLAPLGSITVNASSSISLAPGAVLSVAGSGLVPYGTVLNGTSWTYAAPSGHDPTSYLIGSSSGVSVQQKGISLNTPMLDARAGSTIDLAGGGDVVATEFVPGPGGSYDMSLNFPYTSSTGSNPSPNARNPFFALVPSRGAAPPAYDPQTYQDLTLQGGLPSLSSAAFQFGQTITIGSGSAIPAGTYTILPPRYALLPGAFAVEAAAGYLDMTPGASVSMPDGTSVVAGKIGFADAGTTASRWSGFRVYSDTQFRTLSEFHDFLGSQFLAAEASAAGQAVPRFGPDAGALQINVSSSGDLATTIDARPAASGRGADIAIDAPSIEVSTAASSVSQPASTLVVSGSDLSGAGAETLVLGATDSWSGTGAILSNTAQSIVVDPGASLAAGQVLLAGSTVDVGSGARITGSTSQTPPTKSVSLTGQGAALYVGNVATLPAWSRSCTPAPCAGTSGTLTVASGAALNGASIVLDSSMAQSLAPDMSLAASNVEVRAPVVQLGNGQPGASGLSLSPALLSKLTSIGNLTIASSGGIDVFGTVGLGSLGTSGAPTLNSVTLDGPSIVGMSGSSLTVDAGHIALDNSTGATLAASGIGQGTLSLNSIATGTADGSIAVGGSVTISGFQGGVALSAAGRAQGTQSAAGTGELRFVGNAGNSAALLLTDPAVALSIDATRITADRGVNASIIVPGALTIAASGPAQAPETTELGASLAIRAQNADISGRIDLPAGVVQIATTGTSATDSISLESGASIRVAGVTRTFAPAASGSPAVTADASAGSIALTSASGSVTEKAGAQLDILGAGTQGDAGALAVTAASGAVVLQGGLSSAPGTAARGADISIDAAQLSNFSALTQTIDAGSGGNSADSISMRARTGNITVGAADVLKAHNITLEADGAAGPTDGSLTIGGQLNAAGSNGGRIDLYANNQTVLQQGALLDAHATDSINGSGGQVEISSRVTANAAAPTSLDAISLQTGSRIDVSGGSQAAGGLITLRANAVNSTTNSTANPNDVEIAALPAGSLIGARQTIIEGVIVDSTGAVADAGAVVAGYAPALSSYMSAANRGAMTNRLFGTSAPASLSLRPGLEIQSSGDITALSAIDFASGLATTNAATCTTCTYRYSGSTAASDPGDLTLRAAGNLLIQNNITDGFMPGPSVGQGAAPGTPNGTVWTAGQSWSYTLTAGADLGAANANRTGAAPADLTIGLATSATPVTVRTGTGSIALNASRDVVLANGVANGSSQQGSVIYTAGVADFQNLPAFPTLVGSSPNAGGRGVVSVVPTLTESGGDLSISAGRDVLGTDSGGTNQVGSQQSVNEWLLHGGSASTTAPTVWWTDFSQFQQGFGALGGGNLAIDAGRDVVRVGAVVPSNGYQTPTAQAQNNTGSLTVDAGTVNAIGVIEQGLFYDQAGAASLRATALESNPLSSANPTFPLNAVRLAQGSGALDVQTRDSATVVLPFNPTAFAPALLNGDRNGNYNTMFFTYAVGNAAGSLDVRSAASDVTLLATQTSGSSLLGGMSGPLPAYEGVLAPTLQTVSFGGSVSLATGENATLFPSPTGQAQVLADSTISGLNLSISQADASLLPSTASPLSVSFASAPPSLATPIISSTPLHANDTVPVQIVARNGSIDNLVLNSPKPAEVLAGGAISGLQVAIQNDSADSLSRIDAGGSLDLGSSGAGGYIRISGPGAAEVASGASMSLGILGSGIESRGNLDNPNLAPGGASLIVAAGVARGPSGSLARPDYSGVIDGFVRYDAFASEGSQSTQFNAQVLASLSNDPSLAPLIAALKIGLADRPSALNPASTFNNAINALSPAGLAIGAVKLASAVQTVANQQFVSTRNKDTFAPAYAVLNDLFPNLQNGAGAIRQFVLNNPFAGAPDAQALQNQVLQALPADLAAAIRLGLAAPSSVKSADSSFSKALGAIDPATLSAEARVLLAQTLTVAGTSLDSLRASGSLTSAGSPYAKGLTALAAAFSPTTLAGLNDLNMDYNQIKVNQTGSLAVFAPQGSVIVGQTAAPVGAPIRSAADLGIFTLGGGDVIGMVRDNFDVFRSRVFTIAGGDIDLWSSLGNIDAGKGARDVTVAAPPTLAVDPSTGLVQLDFTGSVSGSGIGALETQPNQPPSNINLMAPAGYVDAGEAGIRAQTGKVLLGTNLVLNAANIQAASGVSGGAVVATPPPPLPPSTSSSNADKTVEEAQREAIAQQQSAEQRAARERRMRVIGTFIGFDDECGAEGSSKDQPESDRKDKAKCDRPADKNESR
jgi:hypothetical protein